MVSKWQDKVISGGQTVMGIVMIPALLSPETTVALTTSIPIAVCLTAFMVAFQSLGMRYAAITSGASAALWANIALLRS